MRKKYLLLRILVCSAVTSAWAQCGIKISESATISCGNGVQLQAYPHWSNAIDSSSAFTFQSVFFTDAETGYSVGDQGVIHKTTDGGKTWITQTSGVSEALISVSFGDASTGYILSLTGSKLLKTVDGGINWTPKAISVSGAMNDIRFVNSSTGFIAGQYGTLLKTKDGGDNWQKIVTSATDELYSIYFLDENNGYVAGRQGVILKTTNGGENWANLPGLGLGVTILSIHFTDINRGYASDSYGNIFKTTDGGITWTEYKTGVNAELRAIAFTDANVGYVAGGYKIWKTVDAGKTWLSQDKGGYVRDLCFPTAKTGYAVGQRTFKYSMADSYAWTPANGLNATNAENPVAAPAVTTTYKVTATTGTCIATDSVTVTVSPFTIEAGSNKNLVCGGSVQLDSVTSNYTGLGNLSYSWYPATGLNAANIVNPKVSITKTATYYVTVTTPNGCSAHDSVTVTVDPLTVDAGSNKTITCGGAAQLSINTNYNGSGLLTYSWLPVSGLTNPAITNPISYVDKTTTYKITITTPNGCTATDSIKVIVNAFVVDAGVDKFHLCGNSSQLHTATNFPGTGKLTYLWKPSTGLNSDTLSDPVSKAAGISYTVTVTTPNGCMDDDVVSVGLVPYNQPEICMVGVDSSGKNVVMWNAVTAPPVPPVKSFNIYRETAVAGNYSKIGTVSGTMRSFTDIGSDPNVKSNKYKLSITDSCDVETGQSSHHKTMHLAINKGVGTSWNLIWENYEGFSVPTYNIYRGMTSKNLKLHDVISGSSNQYTDYNPPPGDLYYQIEVANAAPCEAANTANGLRSNVVNSHSVGVRDLSVPAFSFFMYPNPANDILTLTVEKATGKNIRVHIYDAIGKIVKTAEAQQHIQLISTADLVPGFYMVELQSAEGTAIQKLTIRR